MQGEPVLVAVVADGAGSAKRAEIGARMACSSFVHEIEALLHTGLGVRELDEDIVRSWIERFGKEVDNRAEADGLKRRDLACTILAAVIGIDCAVSFQIGDGAIVISDPRQPENYCYLYWPQQGEYENVTVFLTDTHAVDHLDYGLTTHPIHEVALFTDGLQRLALQLQDRAVHDPFFRPMFAPLQAEHPGYLATLSSSLESFLASPPVNDRTDDDKTLVLATRRTAGGVASASSRVHGHKITSPSSSR